MGLSIQEVARRAGVTVGVAYEAAEKAGAVEMRVRPLSKARASLLQRGTIVPADWADGFVREYSRLADAARLRDEGWLTLKEAAAAAGLTPASLSRRVLRGLVQSPVVKARPQHGRARMYLFHPELCLAPTKRHRHQEHAHLVEVETTAGYLTIREVAELAGTVTDSVLRQARCEGALRVSADCGRRNGGLFVVPEEWAESFVSRTEDEYRNWALRREGWLTVKEAARMLGLSSGGLRTRVWRGDVRAVLAKRPFSAGRPKYLINPEDVPRSRGGCHA